MRATETSSPRTPEVLRPRVQLDLPVDVSGYLVAERLAARLTPSPWMNAHTPPPI